MFESLRNRTIGLSFSLEIEQFCHLGSFFSGHIVTLYTQHAVHKYIYIHNVIVIDKCSVLQYVS